MIIVFLSPEFFKSSIADAKMALKHSTDHVTFVKYKTTNNKNKIHRLKIIKLLYWVFEIDLLKGMDLKG